MNYQNQYQNNYGRSVYKPSNLDWIMVSSIEQVENVAVQPSQRSWIMVQNEPVFALRSADVMGLCTTEYYKFEKMDVTPKSEPSQYVTVDQLNKSIESLKESINESISKLTEQPNKPSNIAKRKTDNADA